MKGIDSCVIRLSVDLRPFKEALYLLCVRIMLCASSCLQNTR